MPRLIPGHCSRSIHASHQYSAVRHPRISRTFTPKPKARDQHYPESEIRDCCLLKQPLQFVKLDCEEVSVEKLNPPELKDMFIVLNMMMTLANGHFQRLLN